MGRGGNSVRLGSLPTVDDFPTGCRAAGHHVWVAMLNDRVVLQFLVGP